MSAPLRLGIAGLGTVGVGVVKIVTEKTALLRQRTGREIVITAVSARSAQKDRGIDLSPYAVGSGSSCFSQALRHRYIC